MQEAATAKKDAPMVSKVFWLVIHEEDRLRKNQTLVTSITEKSLALGLIIKTDYSYDD
jgi:hypothetical protein